MPISRDEAIDRVMKLVRDMADDYHIRKAIEAIIDEVYAEGYSHGSEQGYDPDANLQS